VAEGLSSSILKMLDDCGYKNADVCGICISLPGVIDHSNGSVLYSSKLNLKEFALASAVAENTGVKTYIFKDTDALILGEYNFHIDHTFKNIVYINIDDGVGMSYINSGVLLQPGYGGGFELGHITIDSNGPVCRCGNSGCLGAVVSEIPVLDKVARLVDKGYETDIKDDIGSLSLPDIVQYSNKGDRASKYVLEEQARLLGTAVASIVNLFNPQLIVIGGPFTKCSWNFMDIIKSTVKERALEIYSRNLEIRFAKAGEEAAVLGMANEVFEHEVFRTVSF
jgi:predicted NBD/HSP70 family sugar kinase